MCLSPLLCREALYGLLLARNNDNLLAAVMDAVGVLQSRQMDALHPEHGHVHPYRLRGAQCLHSSGELSGFLIIVVAAGNLPTMGVWSGALPWLLQCSDGAWFELAPGRLGAKRLLTGNAGKREGV